MESIINITGAEFRRMQLIQLDMLIELDRVCRKNNINYVIFAGTQLGAVRHKGYIPWDDDADVAMLREDYEKFKLVANQLDSSICYFQDHSTEPEYIWGYGKLRRTGTTFVRVGQEHMKSRTGVFIDIFPLDDVPSNLIMQMCQSFHCFCLRKILWAQVAKVNTKGPLKLLYGIISTISPEKAFQGYSLYVKRSNNETSNGVRILSMPPSGMFYKKNSLSTRYWMPKKWFLERIEYEFEDVKLYGMKYAHDFLTYEYGDYMSLPPIEKRTPHAPVSSYYFADIRKECQD